MTTPDATPVYFSTDGRNANICPYEELPSDILTRQQETRTLTLTLRDTTDAPERRSRTERHRPPGEEVMTHYLRVLIGTLFSALLMTAGSAFAAPDCGMNTGKAATGTPIPIGTVTTASGVASFHEADLAVQAYFKCVNANGGVFGRPIVYYQEDDQSKLDIAAQAAKKLVEDIGVYALIGSTSVIECIANAAYYAKHDVLVIGEGIPPQCFESKNIAAVNAGARQ